MSAAYTPNIRSRVVDMRVTKPREGERFLVDTNVWYWTTYSKADQTSRGPREYQRREYPSYLFRVLEAGGYLLHASTVLLELLNVIEASEAQQWFTENPPPSSEAGSRKAFRHGYPERRAAVLEQVRGAWNMVRSMSDLQEMVLDAGATARLLDEMKLQEADGNDAILLSTARREGVAVITDDIDLATGEGVTVYTANARMVDQARGVGRLG